MKKNLILVCLALSFGSAVQANLLANGNLDKTYLDQITTSLFLPKPKDWSASGSRAITGPYKDEFSSESWAGPAPTPVTTDGNGGTDQGLFFKPFTGSTTDGAATGNLFQDVAATVGTTYMLTGWAGAEANAQMRDAVFAVEFLDASGGIIGSNVLSLMPTLKTANGEAFSYKKYSVLGTAPAGSVKVRSRVSMIDAMSNPNGGGQAFVVDDFELVAVPEPSSVAVIALGGMFLARRRRK